jgi:hypothetical protein
MLVALVVVVLTRNHSHWCWWCSFARRARRPPGRGKPGAGGAHVLPLLVLVLMVLPHHRSSPTPAPTARIDRPQPPLCCKTHVSSVSDVSYVCYKCVDAKVDMQTQRANTRNRYPKRASRFDLLIDKDEDMSTLVLTTAIRLEVTAKRYSHGTRGSSKIAMEQCNSSNR